MRSLVRRVGFASIFLVSTACGGFGTDVPDGGPSFGVGAGGAGGGGNTDGSSGSAGSAGSTGTGGAKPIIKTYGFDLDGGPSGWTITDSTSAADKMPVPKSDVTPSLNTTDGQPTPGSLQLNIPYTTGGQYVSAGVLLNPGIDLTGRIITARVKIVSGLETPTDLMNAPAGAKIYVKSTMAYIYESGAPMNLTSIGVWTPISFDYTHPGYLDPTIDAASFNPADIREIGIQIDSGGPALAAQAAVVLIDTVAY
jgi:hypothetical protein